MEANNAAAMREALEAAKYCLVNRHTCSGYTIEDTLAKIEAALALPRRNCDVGTTMAQIKRFVEYCKNHRIKITGHADACNPKCPCRKGGDLNLCTLAWARLPYEEGGAK